MTPDQLAEFRRNVYDFCREIAPPLGVKRGGGFYRHDKPGARSGVQGHPRSASVLAPARAVIHSIAMIAAAIGFGFALFYFQQ
jgi:hypothetical protein